MLQGMIAAFILMCTDLIARIVELVADYVQCDPAMLDLSQFGSLDFTTFFHMHKFCFTLKHINIFKSFFKNKNLIVFSVFFCFTGLGN